MKQLARTLVALIVAALFTVPLVAQNPDPSSLQSVKVSIGAQLHTNSATTGSSVDRSGYAGAYYALVQGHSIEGAGVAKYVVLQDSGATHTTWTAVDSILADSIDNDVIQGKSYSKVDRYLRLVWRANSAATDSTFGAGFIVLSGKRFH